MKNELIFAIETSCDESACAIVENGRKVISSIISTQIPIHREYGGVIPEVAAREHLLTINAVIEECFNSADIDKNDITSYASTLGPGLVGCLLIGANAAKTLSVMYNKPYIGVNHLKGHVCANYLETDLEPPFICLLVSGGHTQIIDIKSYSEQTIIGETIDDAVGECYDKVARLFNIPYPGGPNLDKLAQKGNFKKFYIPKPKVAEFDFSFSGIKTHMLKLVNSLKNENEIPIEDIAASFQHTVAEYLIEKVKKYALQKGYNTIALAGGVAANSEIRKQAFDLQNDGFKVYAPPMKFCTDNAAMIASAAYFLKENENYLDKEVFSRI